MEFKSEIKKISENFYEISQSHVRAFLLVGTEFNILVDTCFGGDILEAVKSISDKPLKVIFTHCDRDHIGGESLFEEKYIHPAEYSCNEEKNGSEIDAAALWEGDIMDNGNFKLEVIHIPGHTPGSIALLEREKRFLIGGDSIQTGTIYMFGQGRSLKALKASINKLIKIKDDFDVVYSSHNQREISPETLCEIEDFIGDLIKGNYPKAENTSPNMPANVKIYRKGNVSFFLYEV
ncbi:MAG: MBL fold metallo-hydrolase [Ruminococcaceae bacterium]|nr:MBL fold metallo-hydrolase [Oscillospiraceae bacterium]